MSACTNVKPVSDLATRTESAIGGGLVWTDFERITVDKAIDQCRKVKRLFAMLKEISLNTCCDNVMPHNF